MITAERRAEIENTARVWSDYTTDTVRGRVVAYLRDLLAEVDRLTAMTTYAVVWHDKHTDPDVYLFDTEAAARSWLVNGIIEYLESYTNWRNRVAMAARLRTMPVEDAYTYINGGMLDDMGDDLEYLDWHITLTESLT